MSLDRKNDLLKDKLSLETLEIRAFGPLIQFHLLVIGSSDLQLVDLLHVEICRFDKTR